MTNTIRVSPVAGAKLPIEGNPRRYVDKTMSVPNTAYYRRALRRKDITLAGKEPAVKKAAKSKPAKAGAED